MRFLLNMNAPPELGRRLAAEGHVCRHVRDISLARADDTAILETARANQEAIITHDLDYCHLLAFSGEPSPSVIIYRLRNTHPANLFARIKEVWPEIEQPLSQGAIITLEDATLRIRRLPITQER